MAYNFQQFCLKSQNFIRDCVDAIKNETGANTVQISTNVENWNINSNNVKQKLPEALNYYESQLKSSKVNNYSDKGPLKTDYLVYQSAKEKETDSTNERDYLRQVTKKVIFFRPLQCQRNTATNQTMRLAQYSTQDVRKIIKDIRERYSREQRCFLCNFISKDLRAMSVHMTKLH